MFVTALFVITPNQKLPKFQSTTKFINSYMFIQENTSTTNEQFATSPKIMCEFHKVEQNKQDIKENISTICFYLCYFE